MDLEIKRVILFVRDVAAVAVFYREVLGLRVKNADSPDWLEFDAGACTLALHNGGTPNHARRSPKIVFAAADVEGTREELMKRGARLGPVKGFGTLQFCDGKDPEGNVFQISNRS
jgi:catechol-2,3-dioxygenase